MTLGNYNVSEYIVYYTSDPTLDTKRWFIKTTEKMMTYIGDIVPHTSYYFKVQARNAAGYGPLSTTVVYNPPTGRLCVCVRKIENVFARVAMHT